MSNICSMTIKSKLNKPVYKKVGGESEIIGFTIDIFLDNLLIPQPSKSFEGVICILFQ